MSTQVYSVPGQTEGEMKTFLEGWNIDLSSKVSIFCEGNVNYHKRVYHPILLVGIGTILEIFKPNQ